MPAKGKATPETYRLGLRLIALRKKAKHGEWLAALQWQRISQPTAWRYMKFAAAVKAGDPRWGRVRELDRIWRRIQRDEQKHGRPDLTKLATVVADLKTTTKKRRTR